MSEGSELQILLTGYVDGELDEQQRARVEAALKEDAELRRELAGMRQLRALTDACLDETTDAELDRFWGAVYNRMERHAAWILLTGGLLFVCAGLLLLFFRNGNFPLALRVSVGCAVAGFLLMFWSVLRERMRVMPHDRYSREVHR